MRLWYVRRIRFLLLQETQEASPTSSQARAEPSDSHAAASTAAYGHAATWTRPVLREPSPNERSTSAYERSTSANERSTRARPILRKSSSIECPARPRPILCEPTSHVYSTAARPRTALRKPNDGATGTTTICWAKPTTCNSHATTGHSTDAAATNCSIGPSNPSHERAKNIKSCADALCSANLR